MKKCLNCGHVFNSIGKNKNSLDVLHCAKCNKRFDDNVLIQILNDFNKGLI